MTRKTPAPYDADFQEWVDDLRGRLFRTYGQCGLPLKGGPIFIYWRGGKRIYLLGL